MKKSVQARVLVASVVFVFCFFMSWIGGYDFDRREPEAAFVVLFSLAFAALAAACPLFEEMDK